VPPRRHSPGPYQTRSHARYPPPPHIHRPASPRPAPPELVHGLLPASRKRHDRPSPRLRPHRPPLASMVTKPVARSGSPSGATRAPRSELSRAPQVLPGDDSPGHSEGCAPTLPPHPGAPAAHPRRRRRLHPPPERRRPASIRRSARARDRPQPRPLPAHRSPRSDRGTDHDMGGNWLTRPSRRNQPDGRPEPERLTKP